MSDIPPFQFIYSNITTPGLGNPDHSDIFLFVIFRERGGEGEGGGMSRGGW